jgi:hypothetical protein
MKTAQDVSKLVATIAPNSEKIMKTSWFFGIGLTKSFRQRSH